MTDDDIKTVPFITYIPDNAIKIVISATILDDNDEFHQAQMTLKLSDIREGMIDGDQWESENVKYVVNEEYLKELQNK